MLVVKPVNSDSFIESSLPEINPLAVFAKVEVLEVLTTLTKISPLDEVVLRSSISSKDVTSIRDLGKFLNLPKFSSKTKTSALEIEA